LHDRPRGVKVNGAFTPDARSLALVRDLPPHIARRALAYRMNGEGWTIQMGAIERYVGAAA